MRLNPFRNPFSSSENQIEDLGFGEKIAARKGIKLINKDGNFNIHRSGTRNWFAYQWLIEMSWPKFFLNVLSYYITINLFLAVAFYVLGPSGISGVATNSWYRGLMDCFFFSVQTFTTVGYGTMSPIDLPHQLLAAFGALVGLMSLALATGLLFARFSKPQKLLAFSSKGLISPFENGLSFQFRLAGQSSTKLINVTAQIIYSWVSEVGGQRKRNFQLLTLERSEIAMLPLSWTVVHPIDISSPLAGLDPDAIHESDGEFIVQISAYDETYARQIFEHMSYHASCLKWNHKFIPMYNPSADGKILLHLDKIDQSIAVVE